MWWLLAREVLTLRGKISRQSGFVLEDKEIMPDLYFYRDPQEQEKEEAVEAAPIQEVILFTYFGFINFSSIDH